MRKAASLLVVTLVAGIVSAVPASASFGAVIHLPEGVAYSPFGGPATVTFVFDGADPAAVFTLRLRQPGQGTVRQKDVLVDPAVDDSPHAVPFSWPDLSVETATDYVIDVRPQAGGSAITSEGFAVYPRMIADPRAKPSTFYPLIEDGYKDTTTIRFTLAVDTIATTVTVFRADAEGRCCGTAVRTADLGPRAAGTRRWVWDGTRDDASPVPKGRYFVRVRGTDAGDVSASSRALKVEVATGTIRETATKRKVGSAYARAADERQTAIGGDCNVTRDTGSKTAFVLCANAEISLFWKWRLGTGERIESVAFSLDAGAFGCRTKKGHTRTESYLRVIPTSTCTVTAAKITYSYPVDV